MRSMHASPTPRARLWIERFGLARHPEGGWYRETFRSTEAVATDDGRRRSALTLIHFVLDAGEASAWHSVQADEGWCWHEGDALELLVAPADLSRIERIVLGPDSAGGVPHHVVPKGAWQAARSLGAGTLVSCCVAPGFDFADFRMLADDPALAAAFRARFPDPVR